MTESIATPSSPPGSPSRWVGRRFLEWAPLILLMIGFFLVEGTPLLGDGESVLDRFEDDAYYNFQVARNVALGRGMTFDGVSPTNGVHPTVFLTSLPFFFLAGTDRVLPVRLYGFLLLGLYALLGWRLW